MQLAIGDKIWPLYEQLSIFLSFIGHILVEIKICHNWVHDLNFSLRFSCLQIIQPSSYYESFFRKYGKAVGVVWSHGTDFGMS